MRLFLSTTSKLSSLIIVLTIKKPQMKDLQSLNRYIRRLKQLAPSLEMVSKAIIAQRKNAVMCVLNVVIISRENNLLSTENENQLNKQASANESIRFVELSCIKLILMMLCHLSILLNSKLKQARKRKVKGLPQQTIKRFKRWMIKKLKTFWRDLRLLKASVPWWLSLMWTLIGLQNFRQP